MRHLLTLLAASRALLACAQTLTLDPVIITATRGPQKAANVPFSQVRLDATALRASPATTLDGALRSVPGFSLFRRSDSLTANPTAQGVSLRGLGPSGASRSLVLLDGVPLNDPFGGWVTWSKISRESLASVELVRGGGATAWGNASLGGVVQVLTEFPTQSGGGLVASAGDFSTRSAELGVNQVVGNSTLQISGRDFDTNGFSLVAPEDRGPIDIGAWSRHHWLTSRWRQQFSTDATLTITGRSFAEKRGNGTPAQRNASRENFGSVKLDVSPQKNFSWSALAYAQDQVFSSTFTSINATRTAETPASDQFAVPAVALGGAWTAAWTHASGSRTNFGTDLRHVRGETREHYSFSNGAFTRQRVAGGTQDFAGIFALHEQSLAANWRATLGGRLDYWRETDGHRREQEVATGIIARDDHYADRDGVEFSPSAGLVWQATETWRLRAAAQYAFRRPTLNELYRPFRVGNVITEANAALETEHVASFEVGTDYTRGTLTLGGAVFHNEFRDAVGNVTLERGPGTFPLFGFIPAGGVGRQRLNLDRLRVRGVELTGKWQVTSVLSLDAAYLYNDATVQRAALAPPLEGKRLAQVPRHTATLGASWRAPFGLTVTPRLRWLSRQFEDDENQLILGEVVIIDLGASYAITPRAEIFANLENLTDTRIETGRSADGLVNTGTPRFANAGVRFTW
ncbi:TonB-dependent receptor [Oleiharenicola lentus]|uniref:TonB-dependent receptor n=1 Tax=Oleiharenicola lentus TaxID=2508720 RepID=UPI003F6817AC